MFSKKHLIIIFSLAIVCTSAYPFAWQLGRILFSAFIKGITKEVVHIGAAAASSAIISANKKVGDKIELAKPLQQASIEIKQEDEASKGEIEQVKSPNAIEKVLNALSTIQTVPFSEQDQKTVSERSTLLLYKPKFFESKAPQQVTYSQAPTSSYYLAEVPAQFSTTAIQAKTNSFDISNIPVGQIGGFNIAVGTDFISLFMLAYDCCKFISEQIIEASSKPPKEKPYPALTSNDYKFFKDKTVPASSVFERLKSLWASNNYEFHFKNFVFYQYQFYQFESFLNYARLSPEWKSHLQNLIACLEDDEDLDFEMRGVPGFGSYFPAPLIDYSQAAVNQLGRLWQRMTNAKENPLHLAPSLFLIFLREELALVCEREEQAKKECLAQAQKSFDLYVEKQNKHKENVLEYAKENVNTNAKLVENNSALLNFYAKEYQTQTCSFAEQLEKISSENSEVAHIDESSFQDILYDEELLDFAQNWMEQAHQNVKKENFLAAERFDQRLEALYNFVAGNKASYQNHYTISSQIVSFFGLADNRWQHYDSLSGTILQHQAHKEIESLLQNLQTAQKFLGGNLNISHFLNLAARACEGAVKYNLDDEFEAAYMALDVGQAFLALAEGYSSLTAGRNIDKEILSATDLGAEQRFKTIVDSWKEIQNQNNLLTINSYTNQIQGTAFALAKLISYMRTDEEWDEVWCSSTQKTKARLIEEYILDSDASPDSSQKTSYFWESLLDEERVSQKLAINQNNARPLITPLEEILQQTLSALHEIQKQEKEKKEAHIENENSNELPDPDDDPEAPEEFKELVKALLRGASFIIIKGRKYTRHAIERIVPPTKKVIEELHKRALGKGYSIGSDKYKGYMQPRGVPPSAIEDAIKNGKVCPRDAIQGTTRIEGKFVTAIINDFGDVVSAWAKKVFFKK